MRLIALAGLLAAGCAVHAQPLADLRLVYQARVPSQMRSDRRILVVPFEDARGPVYTRSSPDAHIPVVNWLHQGRELHYPEQAGKLRHASARGAAVTVGEVGGAMPALIVDAMRHMGLSERAEAGGRPDLLAPSFDYVLTGRVLRTRVAEDESFLLGVALGIIGVPFRFHRYDLAYEVSLWDNRDPTKPVFQRCYTSTERRAGGLYYNHDPAYSMFVRGLERSLPRLVEDLAAILAARV